MKTVVLLATQQEESTMKKKIGFTLTEIVVVFGIITILVAILLPVLARARAREAVTQQSYDKNAARFTTEPSPLDKVLQLQYQASTIVFPNSNDLDETIGTFYVWSANMGEGNINIVTVAPRVIGNDELLYRTPDTFWKKDGQLGPHNEELLHNEVEAVLLAPEIKVTKGMSLKVQRHEQGFLYGTPINS